jgi:hypothetical protein
VLDVVSGLHVARRDANLPGLDPVLEDFEVSYALGTNIVGIFDGSALEPVSET